MRVGTDDTSVAATAATIALSEQRAWVRGQIGWALLWLVGIPLPVVFAIYVISPN